MAATLRSGARRSVMPGKAPEPFTRRRILIVEDDDLMRVFYERLFKRHEDEFIWHLKPNVAKALEHLRECEVDAVILDWDMAGVNGLQLLKAIRSNPGTKSLRVILVSGRVQTEDQVLALERGADDYLAKPFHVEILLARLRSLLRR
jgi:DNA-binding response OmpR family regulator